MNSKQDHVPLGSLGDIPNLITIARIDLTLVCFVCLAIGWYRAALISFVVAASTDWVDGWWARKYNQITQIGRVLDPFADKLLICGVFVFLASIPRSDIAPWMAVLVLGRELLVTALRSFIESSGGDFSAKYLGKLKMVWQCLAAGLSLLQVSPWTQEGWAGSWLTSTQERFDLVDLSIWGAILFTLWSGLDYLLGVLAIVNDPVNDPQREGD